MARAAGGKRFNVKVEGLSNLADAPGWLDHAQRRFLECAVDQLGDEVRKRAPGGPNGQAGRDVEARTLSSTKGIIQSRGWIGAKTLEFGAVIKAPAGGALRLRDGRFIHSSRRRRRGSAGPPPGAVFVPPKGYYRKGLRSRGRVVRAAFQEAFDDISRGSS